MPIYEFECPIHGRFGGLFLISEFDKIKNGIPCNVMMNKNPCGHIAEKIISLTGNPVFAPPTIIFRNPRTGETEVATHNYDTPREGFVKEELRGSFERNRFEKEANERRNVEDEITSHYLESQREGARKNRHAEIRNKINQGVYDNQTTELMRAAMRHSNKREKRIPRKKTNVYLEVNHKDSSNLIKD